MNKIKIIIEYMMFTMFMFMFGVCYLYDNLNGMIFYGGFYCMINNALRKDETKE